MGTREILKWLRQTARPVMRRPGFALVSMLILALGIGANSAIFSMVSAVLLRPLPYADPDELVVLREYNVEEYEGYRVSPATFRDWRAEQRTLASLAAISEGRFELGGGDEPREVQSAAVSAEFFDLMGVPPALGSGFVPEHDAPGAEPVVVLSHALWVQRYGADSAVVGGNVRLGDRPYRIVGIAAPGFEYPGGTEVWTPLGPEMPDFGNVRGARFLLAIGRLRPDVDIDAAEADLSGISAAVDDPDMRGWRARLTPLAEEITGDVRPALLILFAAVAFVLLIACANVANLLLARATRRQEELAIRAALGAGRARLTAELLSETLLLSLGGGLLGLLLASWGLDLLVALGPQQLPRTEEIAVDLPVLAFTFGISLLTGLLAGIVPSLRFSRPDLTSPLRQAGGRRIAGGLRANQLRSALVIGEVALSLVLLVGAGLMVRSFLSIVSVETGLDPERVLTFDFSLPSYRYPDESSRLAFSARLLERARAIPGVEHAGLTRNLPLSGRRMTAPVRVQGVPSEDLADRPHSQVSSVTPGYFRAMGIRLIDGRTFTLADDERAPPVTIVNETFARIFFPGQDPIGRRARTLFGSDEMKEIVGVVADVHHLSLTREAEPKFYQPMAQFPATGFTLVARVAPEASGMVAAVKTAVGDIDPQLPVARISSMEALLSRSVAQPRFYASMLAVFAALAVILASVGFYAVMAGSVAERRREIGIRMAVGARMSQVVRMVVGEGAMITGVGLAVGLIVAFVLTRLLEGLLFRVSVTDPFVFAAVTVLLAVVAGLATYLPARSAARIDPMLTLRE